jgi:DnaJ-domain-containing protein 1
MSISKRLIDLARSELNSLLERAARTDEDGDYDDRSRRAGGARAGATGTADVSEMSDEELAAEIERRRRAREEVEDAVHGKRRTAPPPPPRTPPRPRTASGDDAIRKAYAALEVPAGSDFEIVRKSYRRLMRKYHPDLHVGTPDKNRAATDLTQRLTQAYKTLEKHLR